MGWRRRGADSILLNAPFFRLAESAVVVFCRLRGINSKVSRPCFRLHGELQLRKENTPEMAEETDWRLTGILRDHVKHLEEHATRVGNIVDEARKRFNQDYTGAVAGFSALVVIASLAIAPLGVASMVCVTGLAVGGIGLVVAMTYRHLNQRQQVRFIREMTNLERERARFAQRAATLEQIWLHGLPEGMPLVHLQVLLGDTPSAVQKDAEVRWKALPPAHTGDIDSHVERDDDHSRKSPR